MIKSLWVLLYILPSGESHVWLRDLQWEMCLYRKGIEERAARDVNVKMAFACRRQT